MNRIVGVFGVIGAIVAFILIFGVVSAVFQIFVGEAAKLGINKYSEYSDKKNFEEIIVSSVAELNERLPITISGSSITEAFIDGKVVVLRGTLDKLDQETSDLDKAQKSQKITNLFFICQADGFRLFFKGGFNIKYDYYSPNGASLFANQISENDCLPFFDEDKRKLVQYYIKLQKDLLPWKLDSETIALDIRYRNNSVESIFQFINYSKEELDINAVEKLVNTNSLSKNCVAPDAKVFFERGLSVKDTYVDKNNNTVYSFETTKDMC